ncbi:MAG: membrane protein insertion efficiency factor YidD [Clostridia bacterium]|jgi:putative membrane protein insertion efficiency factor|nr:membrane protein insertion efficiency factor YidD [Clostridia bacterium]
MKRVLLAMLRFYKRSISPLLPPACKYTPTCSEYAMEAIEVHGAFKGTLLAIWRVLRCNPFSRGGYDPVPKPHHK